MSTNGDLTCMIYIYIYLDKTKAAKAGETTNQQNSYPDQ